MGESTGHLQLVGETALAGPLLGSVRVHWPLLGAQLHLPDRRVRLWTLARRRRAAPAAARLGQAAAAAGRDRPGLRFVLADTDWYRPPAEPAWR